MVGAGQAGLAMGYFLAREGKRFVILERADSIGSAWRDRWESLTLFTPRRYSGLPGLPFPGDPEGYPSRDEVIAYLERYAETFDLPIELNSEVKKLEFGDDRRLRLEVDGRTISADQVVVATGPFQTPFVPKLPDRLADDVFQTHAVGYRRPDEVPDGTVLVVDAVVWATGYRADYSWINLPIFDQDGRLHHRRGVTAVPGHYFLGLTWQYTRGSALIGWVRDDAEFIAERIAAYQESKARPSVRTPVGAGASAQARLDERS